MNPRERPGKRGLVFPPGYSAEEFTPAEEEAHERLQEAEGERTPIDGPAIGQTWEERGTRVVVEQVFSDGSAIVKHKGLRFCHPASYFWRATLIPGSQGDDAT